MKVAAPLTSGLLSTVSPSGSSEDVCQAEAALSKQTNFPVDLCMFTESSTLGSWKIFACSSDSLVTLTSFITLLSTWSTSLLRVLEFGVRPEKPSLWRTGRTDDIVQLCPVWKLREERCSCYTLFLFVNSLPSHQFRLICLFFVCLCNLRCKANPYMACVGCLWWSVPPVKTVRFVTL